MNEYERGKSTDLDPGWMPDNTTHAETQEWLRAISASLAAERPRERRGQGVRRFADRPDDRGVGGACSSG